jgi:hypothetical protein
LVTARFVMDVLCYNRIMASRIITTITDDITGDEGAETLTFAVNGTHYEIDLTEVHVKEFHAALGIYVDNARKVAVDGRFRSKPAQAKGRRTTPTSSATVTPIRSSTPPDPKAVRAWAMSNGKMTSTRGRVPKEITAEYIAAVGA